MKYKKQAYIVISVGITVLLLVVVYSAGKERGDEPAIEGGAAPARQALRSKYQNEPAKERSLEKASRKTHDQRRAIVDMVETHGAEAALSAAMSLKGAERAAAIFGVLTSVSKTDPEFSANAIPGMGLSSGHVNIILSKAMRHWRDPATALEWIDENLDNKEKEVVVGILLERYSRANPDAAIGYFEALSPGALRTQALVGLFKGMREGKPIKAFEYAEQLPDFVDRSRAYGLIAKNWIDSLPEQVIEKIEASPDNPEWSSIVTTIGLNTPGDRKKELYRRFEGIGGNAGKKGRLVAIASWGAENFPDASHFIEDFNNEEFSEVAPTLTGLWAREQPEKAAEWLSKCDSDRDHKAAVRLLVYEWAQVSPESAVEWALGLPAGPMRAEALTALDQVTNQTFIRDNVLLVNSYLDMVVLFGKN